MTRSVGKLGLRLSSPQAKTKWPFQFHDYVDATALPPIPSGAFGHIDKIKTPAPDGTDWGMYLNDRLGDCAVAGPQHCVKLWNAEAGKVVEFDDKSTIKNYGTFGNYSPNDPDSDQGCDMAVVAKRWMTKGLVDAAGKVHKIGAALELQAGNLEQLWYASYYFDGVGLGIAVVPRWQDDFANGLPWSAGDFNPNDIVGGHFVPAVAREDGDIDVVTWGGTQTMTPSGFHACNKPQLGGRVFCYATQEKLKNGIDLEGLSWSDMRSDMPQIAELGV